MRNEERWDQLAKLRSEIDRRLQGMGSAAERAFGYDPSINTSIAGVLRVLELVSEPRTREDQTFTALLELVEPATADSALDVWSEIGPLLGRDAELASPSLDTLEIVRTAGLKAIQIAVRAMEHADHDEHAALSAALQELSRADEHLSLIVGVRASAQVAENAADAAREAAGQRSELRLSDEFENLRRKEARSADQFRALTILFLVMALSMTATVVLLSHGDPAVEFTKKLAIGIPALLLAGYLGREAGQHRQTARWASVRVAQLKSIRAYTVELSETAADDLRTQFGRKVFLETPETAGGPAEEAVLVAAESTLSRALERAIDRAIPPKS